MSKPTQSEIRDRIRELRHLVENDPDLIVQRVAYAMEHELRWAAESTVGWPSGTHDAKTTATLIRRDLNEDNHE